MGTPYRRRVVDTRLLSALLAGSISGTVGFLAAAFLASLFFRFGVPGVGGVLFMGGPTCFLGGMVSGRILEPDARQRRWKFLYLAAATPGIFLWAGTVVALLIGPEIPSRDLVVIVALSLFSLAGSVTGYTVGRRRNSFRETGRT
jgi:hypothetical protein